MIENAMKKRIGLIIFSFIFGMILAVLPLPQWAIWFRPEWVFAILIFWAVVYPQYVGMGVAFCLGLLMDFLSGTLLGQHALSFSVVIYLITQFHPQLKSFPLWQQMAMILMLTLLQLALQCWVLEIVGMRPNHWGYWLPAITTTLIWPWFYMLLKARHETISGFQ
jgi:rod shape-determining protein MreD